ncbi:hypothetical protein VTI28DRAFT_3405 [Corynascus sepedonium]
MDKLNDAVKVVREAAESLKQEPDLPSFDEVCRLAPSDAAAALELVNQVIKAANIILSLLPTNHQLRFLILHILSASLASRFDVMAAVGSPSVKDLDSAVELARETLGAIPYLENSRRRRSALYQLTAEEAAASSTAADDEMALDCQVKVIKLLTILFEATQDINLVERAVAVAEEAIEAMLKRGDEQTDKGSANRRQLGVNTLARVRGLRFEVKGALDDLDRAITLLDSSLPSLEAGDSNLAIGLDYLSILLGTRFEQQGDVADLNDAIRWSEVAVSRALSSDPDRPRKLQNLANWLAARAQYTGQIGDLELAINYAQEGLRDAPPDHVAKWLGNLGAFFGMRYALNQPSSDKTDLEQATEMNEEAIQLAVYLDRAAGVLKDALSLPAPGPEQPFLHYCLGETLLLRFEHTKEKQDAEDSIEAYQQTLDSDIAPPTVRIFAAVQAAKLLGGSLERWEEATTCLERAVGLLHVLTPPHLRNDNKQQLIRHFSGVAAAAAAAALNANKDPGHALQHLELGRGIISGFQRSLASLLPQGMMVDEPLGLNKARWRRTVSKEMELLLAEIRRQPRFERFLLPPTAEQLMAAAGPDPIVVANVSEFRCDAFLVERHQIRVVPLPQLYQERIIEESYMIQTGSSSSLPATLKWLWDALVHPVLDALGFTDGRLALEPQGTDPSDITWPRVWWVPVGPLSGLPLHAAGDHELHDGETALDRVMSSYSSSIKALLAGRQTSQPPPPLMATAPGRAVLVSMSATPGMSRLEFTDDEVVMLNDMCPSMHLKPDQPQSLMKDDVLDRLRGCRVFHFAGHGISDPADPSRSRLLLKDWQTHPLTVDDLRGERLLNNPFLAYLSACSTAAIEKLALADEGIHLVSACQLAGFRHVVGTLWTVSDAFCVDVARRFYETLRDEGVTSDAAVCRGLHLAMHELRNASTETVTAYMMAVTRDDNNGTRMRMSQIIEGGEFPDGSGTICYGFLMYISVCEPSWGPQTCEGAL